MTSRLIPGPAFAPVLALALALTVIEFQNYV